MIIVSDKRTADSLAARATGTSESVFIEKDDDTALRRLLTECDSYILEEHQGRRMECILILSNATSLWALQTHGFPSGVIQKADILATTPADLIAKSLLVHLPGQQHPYPSLAHAPIGRQSNTTVHLVIFGAGDVAEALAINTALTAHYPNYCRDTRLRTRITLIDNFIQQLLEQMELRYPHLLEHSWWRTLNLNVENPQCHTHPPLYEGSRKDFVDVEWEFVEASATNIAVRQKLTEWASSETQHLTVALCDDDTQMNTASALTLPEDLHRNNIPILCHTEERHLLDIVGTPNIHPFSTQDCGIETLRTLYEMAKRVHYVYSHCFQLSPDAPITPPIDIDTEKLEQQWCQVDSFTKQCSNIFSAMTLGTKMHSVGISPEEWKEYYALTRTNIETLSEVEHNRWCVEELILGYRPPTPEENEQIEADITLKKTMRKHKIHYDLRAFDDLRADATGKNVNVYDYALTQAIPLILKKCTTA